MLRRMIVPLGCAMAVLTGCSSQRPADLTKAAGFSSPDACIFMPQAEHAFDDMLHATDEDGGMRSDPFINLDGRKFRVESTSNNSPADETYHYRATARFPNGTRWHGLDLVSMTADEGFMLGKDGTHSRWLTFAEPLGKVRAVIRSYDVPLDAQNHAFLNIIDGRSCEGEITLRRVAEGTEMRCEWGC